MKSIQVLGSATAQVHADRRREDFTVATTSSKDHDGEMAKGSGTENMARRTLHVHASWAIHDRSLS